MNADFFTSMSNMDWPTPKKRYPKVTFRNIKFLRKGRNAKVSRVKRKKSDCVTRRPQRFRCYIFANVRNHPAKPAERISFLRTYLITMKWTFLDHLSPKNITTELLAAISNHTQNLQVTHLKGKVRITAPSNHTTFYGSLTLDYAQEY